MITDELAGRCEHRIRSRRNKRNQLTRKDRLIGPTDSANPQQHQQHQKKRDSHNHPPILQSVSNT